MAFARGFLMSHQEPEMIESRTQVDYALTTLQQNQVQFSVMADAKANIMITVCSIVMSISLTQLHRPDFVRPLLTLDFFSAISLVAALLCVIPTRAVPKRKDGSVDVGSPLFNPFFFMHFQHLPRAEFVETIMARLTDTQALYRSLVLDIYDQGLVLARSKYRYLRVSYVSFMLGLVLGIAAALVQAVAVT
jgi:hypothetical protein